MAKAETPTYGIHILKATALFFQILAHAHLWAVQSSFYALSLPQLWTKLATTLGCFALMVPMTAGAVLRMISQTDRGRVVNINWPQVAGTMAVLALFESLKEAAVYGQANFFSWNVLHLAAITVPLTLFLAQFGMAAVWSAALTILLAAPFAIEMLAPLEGAALQGLAVPDWPMDGALFAALAGIFACVATYSILRHRAFLRIHKIRMLAILWMLALLGVFLLLHLKNSPSSTAYLKTLWPGVLIGSRNGFHIWGIFPWAGTIMLGFLLYDLLLRTKAAPALLAALLAAGVLMLAFFFRDYAAQAFVSLSASSGLTNQYMNRTPALAILVIGLFCITTPLAFWLARLGWEKGYVVALSRCILWIYIYQTSVLVFAARFFSGTLRHSLPLDDIFLLFAGFSLVSSLALPLLLQRFPFRIHLQLKRKAMEV